MPGIWEIVLILAFLAWMIVPFFMKKRRREERRQASAQKRRRYQASQYEELDETSYEVLEDEKDR